nr:hypothetical protein [Bradyrhizobium diazoefficiens]
MATDRGFARSRRASHGATGPKG